MGICYRIFNHLANDLTYYLQAVFSISACTLTVNFRSDYLVVKN